MQRLSAWSKASRYGPSTWATTVRKARISLGKQIADMTTAAQESSRTSRLDFIMNEDEFDPDATEPSGTSPAPFNRDGQSPQASNMNDVDAPDTVMPDTTLPTPPPLTPSPGLARVRGTSRARHKIPEMSGFVSFFFLGVWGRGTTHSQYRPPKRTIPDEWVHDPGRSTTIS